jgi:hypothetical protein
MLRVELAQRLLRKERVEFYLIHRRHDLGPVHQVLEMLLAEVRNADRVSPPFGEHHLDRLVRRDRPVEVGQDRMVEQEEIDVVETEAPETALEANESLVIAVVAVPELRSDEQFTAVDPGGTNRLADLTLVAVRGGGVDQAVTIRDRGLDRGARLLRRALKNAETKNRHLEAVVELERG